MVRKENKEVRKFLIIWHKEELSIVQNKQTEAGAWKIKIQRENTKEGGNVYIFGLLTSPHTFYTQFIIYDSFFFLSPLEVEFLDSKCKNEQKENNPTNMGKNHCNEEVIIKT